MALGAMRRMRPTVRRLARDGELAVPFIFCFIADQTQNAPHNIPHNQLSRLRGHQPPSNTLDPLDQLGSIGGSEGRHHPEKEVGSSDRT